MSTLEDTMSEGDIMSMLGGCSVHWGFHINLIVSPMILPYIYHDSPQCTHDIPLVY